MKLPVKDVSYINRRSAPRYFLVCGLAQVKCLSQGSPLKHDGRRKTTKRKKRAKGFQEFLYGTSGGRNSKGSSPGPPGRKNKNNKIIIKKDGHIPLRKTHSMFYAYLQCSVASVLSRGMGLSPGFYFILYFWQP